VATTTGLPALRAGAGELLLDARHRFERHFHAEIATGNHERIGQFDDLVDAFERLRLLDLRHQTDPATRDLAHLGEIFRPLDEGQRHPVDILTASTASRSLRSFSVSAPTPSVVSGRLTPFRSEILVPLTTLQTIEVRLIRGKQLQPAIVDQKPVSGLNGLENFRMRKIDPVHIAREILVIKREGLARLQRHRAFGKLADPQFRPLKVCQDADRTSAVFLHCTDAADQGAHQLMARMAHVDAEQIRARLVELLDHRLVRRRRSERGEDFYIA
jgi:hypothetical protein